LKAIFRKPVIMNLLQAFFIVFFTRWEIWINPKNWLVLILCKYGINSKILRLSYPLIFKFSSFRNILIYICLYIHIESWRSYLFIATRYYSIQHNNIENPFLRLLIFIAMSKGLLLNHIFLL
jgi:hypothetical protein